MTATGLWSKSRKHKVQQRFGSCYDSAAPSVPKEVSLLSTDVLRVWYGGTRGLAIAAIVWLSACATSGFEVERVAAVDYAPSSKVELIRREPQQPYVVLAKFSGTELTLCALDEPYCSLRGQARSLGANAVWVQNVSHWTRPEQWVNIDGRMTRVPASVYESIDGVFIRYRE